MGGWWGYSPWGAIAVANKAGQPSLQPNWQFVVTAEPLAPVAAIQNCRHPLPSLAKLPAPVAVISKAAGQTGRSSVILRPAGACHHPRELPLPEWSCTYSTALQTSVIKQSSTPDNSLHLSCSLPLSSPLPLWAPNCLSITWSAHCRPASFSPKASRFAIEESFCWLRINHSSTT